MPIMEPPKSKRGKARGVTAGLVPAMAIRMARCSIIGMAGTSPAMTKRELPRLLPLLPTKIKYAFEKTDG